MTNWIEIEKELPECDGSYLVCTNPEDPVAVGIAFYDGYGFYYQGHYRTPTHWKSYEERKKKYGKIEQ